MLSVKFDDIEMSDYITVLRGFTTFDGADFQPELKEIDGGNGSKFLYTRHGYKTIPMPFFVKKNLNDKYDVLEKILSVKEPKPLIFGNMPDRCFYAVPSSTLSFGEIMNWGKGTITWVVPDGLAHATTETTFAASPNADGVLEATIINDGTAPVPISYDITHTAENGYIGIASTEGAMEFGHIEEADGENYQQSEKLIDTTDFSDWTDGTINHENTGKKCGMTLGTYQNKYLGTLSGSVNSTGGIADGGLKYINVPADSEGHVGASNFYLWAESWFEIGRPTQTGITGLNVVTADDKLIASYIIEKADATGRRARVIFKTGGDNPKQVKVINFDATSVKPPNPWTAPGGPWDMKKVGSQISFYWYGTAYTFNVSSLADMEAAKIEYYVGQWNGRENNANSFVTRTYIRNLKFTKLNVDKWRNVPNRYAAGDVVTIDGDAKKPYVNGMLAYDDEVVGTQYFKAPPGTSKVQFYFSSFSDPVPDITATIREAWL